MLRLFSATNLRHLRSAPLRSLLIVVGIAIGVAMYVATRATNAAVTHSFDQIVERIAGRADLVLTAAGGGVPNELVAEVAEVDGVAHAAANLEITTQLSDSGEGLLVLGMDLLGDLHFLPFEVEQGERNVVDDPLAFVNDPGAILVARGLAERHGLSEGSAIRLRTAQGDKEFTVWGILDDSGVASAFGGQVAVMFLDAAQVSFARGTLVDRIDIALAEGADRETVRARVRERVGSHFDVGPPSRLGANLHQVNLRFKMAMWLSGLVALLVGMALIYNAVGIAVAQRRRELGLLRALGVTRAGVVTLFLIEATVLALPGIALGLWLSPELANYALEQSVPVLPGGAALIIPRELGVSTQLAVQGTLLGLLFTWLAAFAPARRGSRMDPADSLRSTPQVSRETSIPYLRLFLVGAVLMSIAWPLSQSPHTGWMAIPLHALSAALCAPAFVVGLRRLLAPLVQRLAGLPARLGMDYVERSLGRSSINVLAMLGAVSMSVAVGGWLSSFEDSLRGWLDQVSFGDLSVTAGSPLEERPMAMPGDVMQRLAPIEGTKIRWRRLEQRVGDTSVQLNATDLHEFFEQTEQRDQTLRVVGGEVPLSPRSFDVNEHVLLSENAAHRLELGAGDEVTLKTPQGTRDFEVRAVVVDYTSVLGALFIDMDTYQELWGDDALDMISVYLDPAADTERVAQEIRTAPAGQTPLIVLKTSEVAGQFFAWLDQGLALARSIEVLVLLIALMGVAGTMIAVVMDRTREIGALRAIGATRGQTASAIVVEAAFMGFCAVVEGIVAGSILCVFILASLRLETGWHFAFVFPYETAARVGALILLTSAAAGLLPAIRAARLDIKQALAYE